MYSVEGDREFWITARSLPPTLTHTRILIIFPTCGFSRLRFLCQSLLPSIEANSYQSKWKVVLKEKSNRTVENSKMFIHPRVKTTRSIRSSPASFGIPHVNSEFWAGSAELPKKENFATSEFAFAVLSTEFGKNRNHSSVKSYSLHC